VGNCVRDLCLIMLWFSWVLSRAFALDCVSLASLACLLFRRRPTGFERTASCNFSGVKMFWPTPLYKASMYIAVDLHAAIHLTP
jgi:hypothetical protein